MSKELRIKDETLLNEAVILYRDQFNLTPSRGFRRDICATVKTYDDLRLWAELTSHWGYTDRTTGKWKARNPLDIKSLLTVFEMKQRQRDEQREREQLQKLRANNEASTVQARGGKRISRRGTSDLRTVSSEPPSQYFRTR